MKRGLKHKGNKWRWKYSPDVEDIFSAITVLVLLVAIIVVVWR